MGLSQIAVNSSKKSEDILPVVERYFRQLAERIRSRHVNRSAIDIPTRVAGVDLGVLETGLKSPEFRESVVYSTVRFKGVPYEGCIMFQYGLLCRLLEISLGGPQEVADAQPQARALSQVMGNYTNTILNDLIEDMIDLLPSGGSRNRNVDVTQTDPSLAQPSWSGKEKTIDVFSATLDMGPIATPYGFMSILLPVTLFERMLGVRAARAGMDEDSESHPENVLDLRVTLIGELERLSLPFHDVQSLEVGDFIPLNTHLSVDLCINQIKKFSGVFGVENGFRAIQIQNVYD